MEASESEKVIQRLNQELQEANEQANSGKHKCVELQGKEGTLCLYLFIYVGLTHTKLINTQLFLTTCIFIYVKCIIIKYNYINLDI